MTCEIAATEKKIKFYAPFRSDYHAAFYKKLIKRLFRRLFDIACTEMSVALMNFHILDYYFYFYCIFCFYIRTCVCVYVFLVAFLASPAPAWLWDADLTRGMRIKIRNIHILPRAFCTLLMGSRSISEAKIMFPMFFYLKKYFVEKFANVYSRWKARRFENSASEYSLFVNRPTRLT